MSHEIEFKLRLPDAEAVARLEARFAELGLVAQEPAQQVNHFFDTAGRNLGLGECVLRLRVENEARYLLTAKGSVEDSDCAGAKVQLESEAEISSTSAKQLLAGSACPLAKLRSALAPKTPALLTRLETLAAGEALEHAGEFSNLRTAYGPWSLAESTAVSLELDRTQFTGRTDFELEVEVEREQAPRTRAALETLLAEANIEWQVSSSKARRFFELRG